MKRTLSIILTLLLTFTMISAVAADGEAVTVKFDDKVMEFDVAPIIENGRTLVPFRKIFEALGCSVFYAQRDGAEIVTARRGDEELRLTIGENKMYYGDKEIALDVAPRISEDRTLVPLRAVSEAFDAKVDWEDETRTALVYSKQGDHKISAANISKEIVAADGNVILNLAASYPVVENSENDEFISTINGLSHEFASGFLFADEELENKANELYEKYDAEFFPMELSTTFTVDTDKNGFLSITNHTRTSMIETVDNSKESIVWDMTNKKQLELSDILIGERETEINQTVYDAFVKYYEDNYGEEFDAKVAEKLGAELNNVRFYLADESLILYFNPGQVFDGVSVQSTEIPYSESFFKIKLDVKEESAEKAVITPLPAAIDIKNLQECTVAASLEKGNAYVDDEGAMQMKVTIYTYDLYDMVDIANLKVGDTILRLGEEVAVTELETNENGLIYVNGGEEKGGFDLASNDSTVYYEIGMNDSKSYYPLGEVVIPVSTEFVYTDASDLDAEAKKYYPGDFLKEDAGIVYDFIPDNTTIVIKDGVAVEMTKHYIP